ncbi:hypothetical protein LCGC14_1808230 [marine sediment metagenome]|uniref:Homing endonuclease LAGLIDADG domain-containing protein n=1 Tax=marine sediment metagenome TaxID=412755 RepID=A0A0F9J276_9ZZZZ
MKELNHYERGFIEGFLDADGCVGISKVKRATSKRGYFYRVTVHFYNTNEELLGKIRDILDIDHNILQGATCKLISLGHTATEELLSQINLVAKEEKRKLALQMIEAIKNRNSHKHSTYQAITDDIYKQYERLQQ